MSLSSCFIPFDASRATAAACWPGRTLLSYARGATTVVDEPHAETPAGARLWTRNELTLPCRLGHSLRHGDSGPAPGRRAPPHRLARRAPALRGSPEWAARGLVRL